jgi:hypothetical protein
MIARNGFDPVVRAECVALLRRVAHQTIRVAQVAIPPLVIVVFVPHPHTPATLQ